MVTDPNLWGVEDKGARSFVFDFDQFANMDEVGVFDRDPGRVQLLDGKIIATSPASNAHAFVTADLVSLLGSAIRGAGLVPGLRVGTQGTIRIDRFSAPEPDVYVARPVTGQTYAEPRDTVLVVEVSLSTQREDLTVKRPIYARANIAESWIVEPSTRSIHVHRQPGSDGTWGEQFSVTEGSVSPLFAPQISIALDDVFQSL